MYNFTCKKCGRESPTYECWRCERATKNIDIADTIYKDSVKKIEIDVEADYKKIIELLTPAFSNVNEIDSSLNRIHYYIRNKYNDFPTDYILSSIDFILQDAISKRNLQQKQNDDN